MPKRNLRPREEMEFHVPNSKPIKEPENEANGMVKSMFAEPKVVVPESLRRSSRSPGSSQAPEEATLSSGFQASISSLILLPEVVR